MASHRQLLLAALTLFLGAASAALMAQGLPTGAAAVQTEGSDVLEIDAIRVSDIRVVGSSVFSSEEIDAYTLPYENGTLTFERLQDLRQRLSAAYLERGYVNSGVMIPDQQVRDGVVVLQAVEGSLTEIDIQGGRRISQRSIERQIERSLSSPLDIDELQETLRGLQQHPLVSQLNAQLLPGDAPGQSLLRLGVTERPPWEIRVGAGNDRATSVGEDRGIVGLTYRGLVGNGDELSVSFGITEGVDDNSISYRLPVGPDGMVVEAYYAEQDSDIVEQPFAAIDIKSNLESWGLLASKAFIREADRSVVGILGFEHKRSESTLLGMPFSFSPGDVDGRAKGSAYLLGIEWTQRRGVVAWAARATLRIGSPAFDASKNGGSADDRDRPDSDFKALLGQWQYVRQMPWRSSRLIARAAVQLSLHPLLAMYKLPIGGRYTVRGYRENQFVRDNGAFASLEYQFPLVVDATGQLRGNLNLALFADHGISWDKLDTLTTSGRENITSVGLGLLWDPLPSLHAELYYGHDLDDQNRPNDALQDRGYHYQLAFRKLF